MVFQVLLPGLFKGLPPVSHFHSHLFLALLINLVVYLAALFLEFRGEVGAPSQVARGEGEEDLKAVDQKIVNLPMNLIM